MYINRTFWVMCLFLLCIFFLTGEEHKEYKKIVIAMIDTGIDVEQLQNGRFVNGYNVIDPNVFPQDDHGHGTEVSSIIHQLDSRLYIMPIKVFNKRGMTEKDLLAQGIIWAVDHGANIINISAGVVSPSFQLEGAVKYAEEKNVLIVAATGNDGSPINIHYPAAFSTVLAVGAVDSQNSKLASSNSGLQLDVVGKQRSS
jgi:subtilisin family serine protease